MSRQRPQSASATTTPLKKDHDRLNSIVTTTPTLRVLRSAAGSATSHQIQPEQVRIPVRATRTSRKPPHHPQPPPCLVRSARLQAGHRQMPDTRGQDGSQGPHSPGGRRPSEGPRSALDDGGERRLARVDRTERSEVKRSGRERGSAQSPPTPTNLNLAIEALTARGPSHHRTHP